MIWTVCQGIAGNGQCEILNCPKHFHIRFLRIFADGYERFALRSGVSWSLGGVFLGPGYLRWVEFLGEMIWSLVYDTFHCLEQTILYLIVLRGTTKCGVALE